MIKSMTGFASATGSGHGCEWRWDIRSVNARGMDARLRVPDWISGLEVSLRPILQKTVARGNVNLTLKLSRLETGQATGIDPEILGTILNTIKHIESVALQEHSLQLSPTSSADILNLRIFGDGSKNDQDTKPLLTALSDEFSTLVLALDEMRQKEGISLYKVLAEQLTQIHRLTERAAQAAVARKDMVAAGLQKNLARILDNSDGSDPDRVAQELALLAIKSDVTEEIDRLNAHVLTARELLDNGGSVGRKLDFLTQEFNREANTLCAKAQSNELTKIGLDLKAVIEQLREQVQNVE